MSYRPPRKTSRSKSGSMRGPSRPINARNAPGVPRPRRIDNVGIALIAVSVVAVLVLVFLLANQNKSSGASTTPGTAANTSLDPAAATTQTAVVFATQTSPDILPRITVKDAKALYDKGDAKFIDVRVADQYAAGHIKGAVNVPQAETGKRLADIPKTGNVIVYCDCPHDEESSGVAYNLRFSAGYTNVKILEGPAAFDQWKNAAYPVER
jgi:rhodanese-related sulfurtransferase